MNRLGATATRAARLAQRSSRSPSPSPKRARAAPASPQSPYGYSANIRRGLAEFRALLDDDRKLIRYDHSQGGARCWESKIRNSSNSRGGLFAKRSDAVARSLAAWLSYEAHKPNSEVFQDPLAESLRERAFGMRLQHEPKTYHGFTRNWAQSRRLQALSDGTVVDVETFVRDGDVVSLRRVVDGTGLRGLEAELVDEEHDMADVARTAVEAASCMPLSQLDKERRDAADNTARSLLASAVLRHDNAQAHLDKLFEERRYKMWRSWGLSPDDADKLRDLGVERPWDLDENKTETLLGHADCKFRDKIMRKFHLKGGRSARAECDGDKASYRDLLTDDEIEEMLRRRFPKLKGSKWNWLIKNMRKSVQLDHIFSNGCAARREIFIASTRPHSSPTRFVLPTFEITHR